MSITRGERRARALGPRMGLPVGYALCAAGSVLLAGCGSETRPNILLYVSDTLRADGLGCYGNEVVETPNVDLLAAEGILFERAMAPTSWTRGSMASLLSGTHPAVHGAQGRTDLLEDSVVLMSELLRDEGYSTANIVTNPNVGEGFGFRQGYGPEGFLELYDNKSALDDEGDVRTVKVEELVSTADEVTRAAVRWLEDAPEPFFLVVHPIDPHSPYTPPDEWDRYGADIQSRADGTQRSLHELSQTRTPADIARIRSLYHGEIAFNDDAFGELVDWLRDRGVYDRTLTVFTSDHGEEFWELGERGHGKTLNEKALHVPLILRYPPSIGERRVSSKLTSIVDVLPTVFELAGIEVPAWIEGNSLLADEQDDLVFATLLFQKKNLASVRRGRWKLLWDRETDRRFLHDVSTGSEGKRNLIEREPDVANKLYAELRVHLAHEEARRISLHGRADVSQVEIDEATDALLNGLGYTDDGDEPEPGE